MKASILILVIAAIGAGVTACGDSARDVAWAWYFDPPNERMAGDRYATWTSHQYVVPLTASGYGVADGKRYDGDPVSYRNSAWNPHDGVLYAYKPNYRPSETWLMAVSVPRLKTEAVTRIPEHPRGWSFSPLFAFDVHRRELVVADAQGPCGGQVRKTWYVYDVEADEWRGHSLDNYALTTLDYDPVEQVYVGVGFEFGESRVVVKLDRDGTVLSQVKADLCAALEPRLHGFDQVHYQSRIIDGAVHVYRHVYYGDKAGDGRYWERQLYVVDIATGRVTRRQTAPAAT